MRNFLGNRGNSNPKKSAGKPAGVTMKKAAKVVINFTIANLEAIEFCKVAGEQKMYYDEKSKLALRVGTTKKVFLVQKRTKEQPHAARVTIGEFPDMSPSIARDKASEVLGSLASGINPTEELKKKKAEIEAKKALDNETLKVILDEYRSDWLNRKGAGSAASLKSHDDSIKFFNEREITLLVQGPDGWELDPKTPKGDGKIVLSDWLERPYRSITKKEVLERYKYFSRAKKSRSGQQLIPMIRTHQIAFKTLQAAYNYKLGKLEDDERDGLVNPVEVITSHRLWTPTNVVSDRIDFEDGECVQWWDAAHEYKTRNLVAANYLLFSLLQGGRSIEIHKLHYDNINLKKREIYYKDTKNGKTYTMWVSDAALAILEELKPISKNGYVFYYPESANGFIGKDAKQHFKNIFRRGGKLISHHDLKRSWGTSAMNLGIDKLTCDYCLKHKAKGVDENYFIRNRALVVGALEKVEQYMFGQVEKFRAELEKEKAAEPIMQVD